MAPVKQPSEFAFALQKYMLLHSQHDALQKSLNKSRRGSSSSSSSSASSSSASSSPERPSHRHPSLSSSPPSCSRQLLISNPVSPISENSDVFDCSISSRPRLHTRRSSLPNTLPVVDEEVEAEEEEAKLNNVNQQIKATLTKLLSCDVVRSSPSQRMWVQSRLMETELELKGSKSRSCGRRRSVDMTLLAA